MSSLSRDEFVRRYGGIYEHSPWVAEETFDRADVADSAQLARLFADCVDCADRNRKLALIRAHPDLAGRASIAGELTDASSEEQSSARLDCCTPEEFARFGDLNGRYREKFGFPFIMAVRNSSRADILAAFEQRIGNHPDVEVEKAMSEIHKIAQLRLEAM